MYELVCALSIDFFQILIIFRSVSVMITLSVRLFESRPTRPPFRSMKRLVSYDIIDRRDVLTCGQLVLLSATLS